MQSQIQRIHLVSTLLAVSSRLDDPDFKLDIMEFLKEKIGLLSAPFDLNPTVTNVLTVSNL
jgi:hypothetical protein